MASEVGNLDMSYGDIESAVQTITGADKDLEDIWNNGIMPIVTDLMKDALGLMVNALEAAINFLKNAFRHFIDNLINLGNLIRKVVKNHQDADRDGAQKFRAAGGSGG